HPPGGRHPAARLFVVRDQLQLCGHCAGDWGFLAYPRGVVLPRHAARVFVFYGREAWHLSNAMQEPVNFLSGLYFPVHALGAYVAGAASLVPMTLGLDAMRQLLLPGTPVFIPAGIETLVVAAQVPIFAVLAG